METHENQEKIKEKDLKLKEVMKINEKLKNLNKELLREVKVSDKKVRDLEKEIQKSMCIATQ